MYSFNTETRLQNERVLSQNSNENGITRAYKIKDNQFTIQYPTFYITHIYRIHGMQYYGQYHVPKPLTIKLWEIPCAHIKTINH